MKMKLLVGALVFLIIVNLATIGTFLYVRFVHPHPPGSEERFGGPPPFMELDEPQREKMKELMEGLRSATSEVNEKASGLERRTFELLQKDPAPIDSIDQTL